MPVPDRNGIWPIPVRDGSVKKKRRTWLCKVNKFTSNRGDTPLTDKDSIFSLEFPDFFGDLEVH